MESYNRDLPATYAAPKSYVRYQRPTQEDLRENIEYVIDAEDEAWLQNNTKFGGSCLNSITSTTAGRSEEGANSRANTDNSGESPTFQLQIEMLETMLDVMEKATAFEAIITMDQAEALILKKLPQLYHLYPVKARAGICTIKHVITDVYNYWVSKRSKLKRPLLRRFWPVTSSDDTNPHLVFRPREKEKYKLRKKRQNDMDAYRKLQQLKQDFQHVKILLDLVRRREELNRSLIQLQSEWFQQKLFDAIDTSGMPRISPDLRRDDMDELLNITTYFETQNGKKGNKKSRRGGYEKSSRSTTPVPDASGLPSATGQSDGVAPVVGGTIGRSLIVAGANHGEPAPLFLHPLPSRETYVTSWEKTVPHVTTFVDSHPQPTFRFRHRYVDKTPIENEDLRLKRSNTVLMVVYHIFRSSLFLSHCRFLPTLDLESEGGEGSALIDFLRQPIPTWLQSLCLLPAMGSLLQDKQKIGFLICSRARLIMPKLADASRRSVSMH